MKTIILLLFTSSLFFVTSANAQPRDQATYMVQTGEVIVTPARCPPNNCVPTTARLKGTFTAFLPGGGTQLFFPDSSLVTQPDVGFQLPKDPNLDEGGTTREAKFSLDNNELNVKGIIDSRAFDGPLIEYKFISVKTDTGIKKSDFFTARPDFRKCISPLCGGYFVKRVNSSRTMCADGTLQKECYVADIQFKGKLTSPALGFGNQTPFLLQGKIVPKEFEIFGNLGSFVAKGAYRSATQKTAAGRFFGIENIGIVCITAPCFSFEGELLNRKRVVAFSSINLDKVNATASQVDQAQRILAEGGTLLAAGGARPVVGLPGGTGREFVASQFYLPIPMIGIVDCKPGYSFEKGACRTPHGCIYPQLELTAIGGAAIIDPITGEVTSTISKSCVDSCNPPALPSGPGQCEVFLP